MNRIVMFALVFSAAASAQNWVEVQGYGQTPRVNGLFTSAAGKTYGAFAWFQEQPGYGQAYAGATYSPKPWVQFALGAGLEQHKNPARVGSYIWLGKGKVSGLGVFEDGGSGLFYKVETNYQLKTRFGLGTLSDSSRGHGPKLEVLVPHTPVKLWAAPLFKDGSVRPLFGIRWSFKWC